MQITVYSYPNGVEHVETKEVPDDAFKIPLPEKEPLEVTYAKERLAAGITLTTREISLLLSRALAAGKL